MIWQLCRKVKVNPAVSIKCFHQGLLCIGVEQVFDEIFTYLQVNLGKDSDDGEDMDFDEGGFDEDDDLDMEIDQSEMIGVSNSGIGMLSNKVYTAKAVNMFK